MNTLKQLFTMIYVNHLSFNRNNDWDSKDAVMRDVESASNNDDYKRRTSLHDNVKMQPCTRWQVSD